MTPYWSDDAVTLHHGDCLDIMRELPDNSVDSVVTDPPYGLGFMGREWDSLPPGLPWAQECLRVLKPGGHLLAFGGTRTWHRLAVAVEDAGFEIRDSIAWLYGSGFPKSLDVSKAIDKARDDGPARLAAGVWLRAQRESAGLQQKTVAAHWPSVTGGLTGCVANWEGGFSCPTWEQWLRLKEIVGFGSDMDAEVWRLNGRKGTPGKAWDQREVTGSTSVPVGHSFAGSTYGGDSSEKVVNLTAPATPAARQWSGWGTAMKPSHEPVVCAQKPFNMVPFKGEASRLHHLIGGLLWLSLSPAKRAELSSMSSRVAHKEAWCASALASAAAASSPGASDVTGMYSSLELASTFSNIVSSWSVTLDALSGQTTTSTTSTRSSTTTDLRTLNSLLGPLTSQTTMPPCGCLHGGGKSSALSAGQGSTDEWARWLHILSASVPERAIEGIALAVESALAQVAASLSGDLAVGSSAPRSATTEAAASSSHFEPCVVARKPLSVTINVKVCVEQSLREQGFLGEVEWANVPVSGAASSSPTKSSGATCQQPMRGTSARTASEIGTEPTAKPIVRCTENLADGGDSSTQSEHESSVGKQTGDFEQKFLPPTDQTAPAAESRSSSSSPLTTSMEEELPIAKRSMARSTPNSGALDSPPVTESFAGIATGLTGSRTHVRIDRLPDGQFIWPSGLPLAVNTAATVAANVTTHGTGALNIDGCRVGYSPDDPTLEWGTKFGGGKLNAKGEEYQTGSGTSGLSGIGQVTGTVNPAGRWPTNVVLDGSQAAALDAESGIMRDGVAVNRNKNPAAEKTKAVYGKRLNGDQEDVTYGGAGGASRFFPTFRYEAKAPTEERPRVDGVAHPTVKPLDLMRWLVRLVTPPGGVVLEPFAGSGTTAEACVHEHLRCIAIEREAEYLPLIIARLTKPMEIGFDFGDAA